MSAYYSEYDANAAAWLRKLIKQGHIADGEVDERDLWDVAPDDIRGFTQVHFCAGIGVWSYALRRAGWPDDRPVWTGSFPCQPFSAAGKGLGLADERHLWPAGHWLIEQCRPAVVFGEQVASKDAEPWLDLVQADLEALAYSVGAVPFPSAGIGAPHIRDRLYWVADTMPAGRAEWRAGTGGGSTAGRGGIERLADDDARLEGRWQPGRERAAERPAGAGGVAGGVADADCRQCDGKPKLRGAERDGQDARRPEGIGELEPCCNDAGLLSGSARHVPDGAGAQGEHGLREVAVWPGPVNGEWRTTDWLYSRDGFWRPVEPGTFPLAHGTPARVGRLRGYGNAINAEAAVAFIESYLEARG